MSDTYFTQQAMKNMIPMLYGNSKVELFATITSFVWLFTGFFPDSVFFLFSLSITMIITILLGLYSFLPTNKYYYNIHGVSFRRMIVGGIAHWAYTGGSRTGDKFLIVESIQIPVVQISTYVLAGLLIIWFATKYYEQLQDPNISTVLYPFLIIRGVLRGAMLLGLLYALFSPEYISSNLAFPYLFVIYLVEPYIYGFSQLMNPTLSRYELTMGNARLPSVALRESFVSNFFILLFTIMFDGLQTSGDQGGTIWRLLQVYYFFGALFLFFYSIDSINKFKQDPLGKNAIADFFTKTPDILNKLDLESQVGHVIDKKTMVDLSKKSGLNIEEGSIVIPLEEVKGKMNALIIGKGQSILDTGKQKIGENIEGVSTVLIPKKEFKKLSSDFIGTKMSEINLQELQLPSVTELKQYINMLAVNFDGFVGKILHQISSIDLSNYGISEGKGVTDVKLPGIEVHETPDLTSVKVGGLRVLDGKKATTVRFGSTFTVVDLPKANFVSLPGITVVDVAGMGSAVNILGFQISDGIPADRLDELRASILAQLDRWEMGIDAELGRYLADKSATGLLSMGWNGEFNLLLDSKKKTMGNHLALESPGNQTNDMHYLPPNFDEKIREQTDQDRNFLALTGMDPTPTGKGLKKASEETLHLGPSAEKSKNSKKSNTDETFDYEIIHDVEVEEDED